MHHLKQDLFKPTGVRRAYFVELTPIDIQSPPPHRVCVCVHARARVHREGTLHGGEAPSLCPLPCVPGPGQCLVHRTPPHWGRSRARTRPEPKPCSQPHLHLGLLVTDLEGHGSLKRGGLWLWVLFPSTGTFLGPDIRDTLVYGKEASVPNRGHILLSAPALT